MLLPEEYKKLKKNKLIKLKKVNKHYSATINRYNLYTGKKEVEVVENIELLQYQTDKQSLQTEIAQLQTKVDEIETLTTDLDNLTNI